MKQEAEENKFLPPLPSEILPINLNVPPEKSEFPSLGLQVVPQKETKMIQDKDHYVPEPYDLDAHPLIEYTTICNADFLPVICNDFVSDYLDKKRRSRLIDRADAIDLTRNFCWWLSQNDLTCAVIQMNI